MRAVQSLTASAGVQTGGLEVRAGEHWAGGGEGSCASWGPGGPESTGGVRVCRAASTAAGGGFLIPLVSLAKLPLSSDCSLTSPVSKTSVLAGWTDEEGAPPRSRGHRLAQEANSSPLEPEKPVPGPSPSDCFCSPGAGAGGALGGRWWRKRSRERRDQVQSQDRWNRCEVGRGRARGQGAQSAAWAAGWK